MNVQMVSLTEPKQSLGEVVSRAAYGNQRIVLLSRGKPKAALVSLADLEWLERSDDVHIVAPSLWGYEVTSVIRSKVHHGKLTADEGER